MNLKRSKKIVKTWRPLCCGTPSTLLNPGLKYASVPGRVGLSDFVDTRQEENPSYPTYKKILQKCYFFVLFITLCNNCKRFAIL